MHAAEEGYYWQQVHDRIVMLSSHTDGLYSGHTRHASTFRDSCHVLDVQDTCRPAGDAAPDISCVWLAMPCTEGQASAGVAHG